MNYKMQNSKIAVRMLAPKDSSNNCDMILKPQMTHNMGVIVHNFEGCIFPVGTKVIFGDQKERIFMDGELDIMKVENIIATVE